jgi:hypothetical protein
MSPLSLKILTKWRLSAINYQIVVTPYFLKLQNPLQHARATKSNVALCKLLTAAIPSLNNASPKTLMNKNSLTCISSNTVITATGSTAEMREANKSESSVETLTLKK